MALQPQDRPAGSQQVLRFQGSFAPDVDLAVFPKANGSMTTGGAAGATRGLRLGLFDATDLTNQQRQFLHSIFDDEQPGGVAPHAAVAATLVANVINAGELVIGHSTPAATDRTWCQNLDVDVKGLSANVGSIDTENCFMVLDTLTSGLGLNSGLPVLIVPITLLGGAVAAASFDVRIEVRFSPSR